ncbi:MAG TPA: C39 family peptidase [bacterium]|nr:C39 family peptidase [bacterium]
MKKFFQKLTTLEILAFLTFSPLTIEAQQSITDLNKQQSYYAAQAEKKKQEAAQKQKEAEEIQRQITAVSNDISTTERALSLTETQIRDTEKTIESLAAQIKDREEEIRVENERMSKIVSSWYMEGESGFFEALVGSETFSDAITKQQYYDSVRQQIRDTVDKIESLKVGLNNNKKDQENRLLDLANNRQTQANQKSYLESKKQTKNRLLGNAKDAVDDLSAQAAAAETKAQEIRKIIAAIYSSSKGSPKGDGLVQDSNWGWYYSQRDPQWSGTYLAPSRLTIGEVGCLVTSFAMVSTYYGYNNTPADIENKSAFTYEGGWLWFDNSPGISVSASQPKNWNVINNELENNRPVIVSVKVSGPVYNSDGSNHFIVISGIANGKYLIHDPYWRDSSYSLSDVISMKIVSKK